MDSFCELSASGKIKLLAKAIENLSEDVTTEQFRDQLLATPLHYAASNGHVGVAEILLGRLGHEALHVQDCVGRTPLHRAIYANRLDMISYLLHLGPDMKVKDMLGYSCLRLITSLYDPSVEYLMRRVEPYILETPLLFHFIYVALKKKDLAMCKKLCMHVQSMPSGSPFYRPFLHQAAEMGDVELVEILLKKHVEPRNIYDDDYCMDSISIVSEDDSAIYRRTADKDGRISQNYAENTRNKDKVSVSNNGGPSTTPRKSSQSEQSLNSNDDNVMNEHDIGSKSEKKAKKKPIELDVVSEIDVILEQAGTEIKNPKPDVYDSDGHLAFHYACQHGNNDILHLLYFDYMTNKDFVKGIRLALFRKRFSTIQCLMALRQEFNIDIETLATIMKVIEQDLEKRGRSLLPLLIQMPLQLTRFVGQAAAMNNIDVLALLFNMKVPLTCADLMGR